MIGAPQHVTRRRFTPLQRLLHWLMAVCILAMLFIGVGMVSTVMPKYLTLLSIHRPLGIAILILALIRLVVRLRYGAPRCRRPARTHKARGPPVALRVLRPDDRHAADRLGHAVRRRLPDRAVQRHPPSPILPQSDSLQALLWNAHFYLAFAFFALILMHVAAALFHALIRRDGVFEAMAPVSTHEEVAPAE